MSVRALLAVLIGLAMLLAPLGLGSAMAMPAADHAAQMSSGGHCDERPADTHDGKAAFKTCCTATCGAATMAATAPAATPALFADEERSMGAAQFGRDFLAELATPPPRGA